MLSELLSSTNILVIFFGLLTLAVGTLAVPNRPWYRPAQGLFVASALAANIKILYWALTTNNGWLTKTVMTIFRLVFTNLLCVLAVRRVQADITEAKSLVAWLRPLFKGLTKEEKEVLHTVLRLGDSSLRT